MSKVEEVSESVFQDLRAPWFLVFPCTDSCRDSSGLVARGDPRQYTRRPQPEEPVIGPDQHSAVADIRNREDLCDLLVRRDTLQRIPSQG